MVKVVTFGCRINAYESEVFREKLAHLEDAIVVNTCAITGEAERQCMQTIRKLKRENPDAKIIITGCAAQVAPQKFAGMEEVDLVLGNKEKTAIEKYISQEGQFAEDIASFNDYDRFVIKEFDNRQIAYVQIQQGCNHSCAYCIVPFARGKSRSVPEVEIFEQIRELIKNGYQEICLTGVDACSYKPSLSVLIQNILQEIPELKKLHFGSLDPAAIDDKFIELTKDERIFPFFHLSIQSGDNRVLKAMRRRHTREKVIDICRKIRSIRQDVIFGADFICGFPTETEEEFQNTVKLVSEAGLNQLHVFPYSIREGTLAASMPQVPVEIRKERAKVLREHLLCHPEVCAASREDLGNIKGKL